MAHEFIVTIPTIQDHLLKRPPGKTYKVRHINATMIGAIAAAERLDLVNENLERLAGLAQGSGPGVVTVEDTNTQVLAANPNRLGVILENIDAIDIWLAWDNEAEEEKGFRLVKDKQIILGRDLVSQGALNAIVANSTAKVVCQELENLFS